jgi:hypothetical protein
VWTCDLVGCGLLIAFRLAGLEFVFFVWVAILVGCWLLFGLGLAGLGLADQQAWLLFGRIGLAVHKDLVCLLLLYQVL